MKKVKLHIIDGIDASYSVGCSIKLSYCSSLYSPLKRSSRFFEPVESRSFPCWCVNLPSDLKTLLEWEALCCLGMKSPTSGKLNIIQPPTVPVFAFSFSSKASARDFLGYSCFSILILVVPSFHSLVFP